MKYALFPFRWLDERVQNVVDTSAHRLMRHLHCERRVLTLMLSLVAIASFAPIFASTIVQEGSFFGKIMWAVILCYGGWNMLTLHTTADRSIYHWRYYILARVLVSAMKLMIVSGIVLLTITGAPHAALTPAIAASLLLGALGALCNIYLQRTPLGLPEHEMLRKIAKIAERSDPSKSAPAET